MDHVEPALTAVSVTMNNVEGRGEAISIFICCPIPYNYICKMATCVATWSFGKQAVDVASRVLSAGGNCVDSLERGVNG